MSSSRFGAAGGGLRSLSSMSPASRIGTAGPYRGYGKRFDKQVDGVVAEAPPRLRGEAAPATVRSTTLVLSYRPGGGCKLRPCLGS
jgi:hypothetical protein